MTESGRMMRTFDTSGYCRQMAPFFSGVEFNYEVMEEELTCPVCLELYADPLILSCSHSVCKKCLQDIFDSKVKKDDDYCSIQYDLECPSCRREVTLTRDKISELPKNLALENVVIRYTEERSKSIRKSLSLESPISDLLFSPILNLDQIPEFPSESSTSCELCDGKNPNVAVWYCNQCMVGYCHSCLAKYHPNKGPLSRHKVTQFVDLTQQQMALYCEEHEQEKVNMFCNNCLVFVCHLCVCDGDGSHVGHTMLAPDSACKKLRESMDDTKSCCDNELSTLVEQRTKLQSYMDEIKTLHNQSVARVEQHYCHLVADLTAALTAEKCRVLKELSSVHGHEVTKIKNCLHDNEKCGEALLAVSRDCTKLLEEKTVQDVLKKASDMEPLKTKLKQYKLEADHLSQAFDATLQNKITRCRLQSGTVSFQDGASGILKLFLDADTKYTTIVPLVKMPTSPGRTELAPRSPVQNKCLITWGFSSTSFTGAELEGNSTWTVTVERNTGGNVNTGCLFGVGISAEPLNIKDLVGSTKGTYGVVCNNGVLYFTADGKQESLLALECLPISITLSVNVQHERYTVLAYKLEAASLKDNQNLPLEGKKVLNDVQLKDIIYPVFTVSQRVKLLFPTYV